MWLLIKEQSNMFSLKIVSADETVEKIPVLITLTQELFRINIF